MGLLDWFGNKKEDRSMVNYSTNHSSGAIFSMFSTQTPINKEQAMKVPAVVACTELISGSIAQLPIYLYKKNEDGEVERIPNDRRTFLLNSEPNQMQNGYNFKKKLVQDYLFYGVSYTKKEQERNNVLELYSFDMEKIQVTKYLVDGYKWDADIKLLYYGSDGKGKEKTFKPHELISILKGSEDGITGSGVLENGSETLELALHEIDYSSNLLKNGALPIGVIQTMNKLSETAIKRLRKGWESLYSGAKNSGKTVILEEGLEYQPMSLKPDDLQLTDGKKITISEVARLFNVPESMLNADANKYASNEQNNLHFLQYTLSPIITAMENSFNKSLLLESEKEEGYYFRFDVSEILRTTEKEKIEAAAEALSEGFVSLNETRSKMDLPKLETDYFMWSLGSVLFNPETDEIIVPNIQGSSDLDNPVQNLNDENKKAKVKKDTKDKLENEVDKNKSKKGGQN